MHDYLIIVAHLGAILGLVSTGFNLYAVFIDRRRARPRLVVSPRVRHLIVAGGSLPTVREGPHIVVEAVNAGPGPITVTACQAALEPLPDTNENLLVIMNAAPQGPPYEVTHGRSITFLSALSEPLASDPTQVCVYDTLGRVWSPSSRDLRKFQREVRKHRTERAAHL